MKKSFLASAWFPFLMCLVLAGVAVAAFAVLKPDGTGIDNSQLLAAMKVSGWAIGPVAGLLSFMMICILNLIRRMIRMRNVSWMHPVTILLGIGFWFVVSWMLLDEPRYTQFAVGIMDYVARPLLWGSLAASLFTVLLSIPVFMKKK